MEAQTAPSLHWSSLSLSACAAVNCWRQDSTFPSTFAYYPDSNEHLLSRTPREILSRIPIARWFRPVFGGSFSFAGLVAGIEVIGAFRLLAGLLFVRIPVVFISHRVLHWTRGNRDAGGRFLLFASEYSFAVRNGDRDRAWEDRA